MRRIRLSPNQGRLLFDTGAAAAAAFFTFLFVSTLRPGPSVPLAIFTAPLFILGLNWAFGIYTKYRIGGARLKLKLLTGTVVLSGAGLLLVTGDLAASMLWTVLSWAPIVFPRVFLNINARPRSDFISLAIRERGPVLVVGGGGYIGSHVVDQLLKAGYPVRVFDKFLYGKDSLQEFVTDPRLSLVEGDVTDIMKLTSAMTGASAVIHLAGLVGDPACAVDESFTRHANVIATRMLKEVAVSLGIPRFVFASSCSVYGANDDEVDETSELNPVSLYARTKIDSEKEILSSYNDNFCPTVLRFATVFGHSRRPRFDLVANLFTAQAFIDGKITVMGENQWRPFINVKDLAIAIVTVLKARPEQVQGETFNVGDSRLNLTIGQLAEIVKEVVSKEREVEIVIKDNIADRRNYFVSFNKIASTLGFQASVLMEEGVSQMLEEFKKGTYRNYHDSTYSNLEMTKRALLDFRDPAQSSRLYGPLAEERPGEPAQAA